MKIEHAVWPTGVPPVCTANWAQEAWDKFAEGYRPSGYTGGIYDDKGYMIWGARKCLDEGRAAQRRIDELRENTGSGLLMRDRFIAARLQDALGAANVCRKSRRAPDYCELGTCFVCTVARLSRGENP